MQNRFHIKFWGVRGSIPCPGTDTVRYGGNTSCIEMQVGGERLIFDGGTGLRVLGESMLAEMPVQAHLFLLTLTGIIYKDFPSLYQRLLKAIVSGFMRFLPPMEQRSNNASTIKCSIPNFPVPLQIMQANLQFYDLEIGETIKIGELVVETARLNHPGVAVGYRVNWRGLSAAYITDTEHFPDRLDENVLCLSREADVVIIDATYTDEEYYDEKCSKVGWGHSTWQEAIKIAKAAKVKQLILFHHDPSHNDDFLDRLGEQAALAYPNTILAREGLSIELMETTNRFSISKQITNDQ